MLPDDDSAEDAPNDVPEDGPDHASAAVEAVVTVLDLMERGMGDVRLGRRLNRICNTYSPHEISQIYRLLNENAAPPARLRLRRLAPLWLYYQNREGAVFHRETLVKGSVLFRSAVQAQDRGTLVCFAAGPDNSMFMSNCRWLEHFGELPMDIVMLSNSFRGEVGRWKLGPAVGQHDSMQRLKALLAKRDVIPRCYVGASAGGEPAMVAATLDPDCTGISLAGRFYRPARAVPLAEAPTPFLPLCHCWTKPVPRLHSIYGADEPIDAENQQLLRSLAPHARIYPIPNDARHNPMASLAARGKLRAVVAQIADAAFGRDVAFDFVSVA